MEATNRNDDEWEPLVNADDNCLEPVAAELMARRRDTANLPGEFWSRQRSAILSRVPAAEVYAASPPIAAWMLAAAMLLIAAVMFNLGPRVTPPPQQAQAEADRELLRKVESAMQSGGPTALEPAALLADEIGQYEQTSSALTNR